MTLSPDDAVLEQILSDETLSAAQLSAVRDACSRHQGAPAFASRVLDALVSGNILTAQRLTELRAALLGFEVVQVDGLEIESQILEKVPREFAEHYQLIPLAGCGETLRVALSDPLATDGPDNLAILTGLRVETVVSSAEQIRRAIEQNYDRPRGGAARASPTAEAESSVPSTIANTVDGKDPAKVSSDDSPLIALVHQILSEAIAARASDIHWEPLERRFRIRFRIDGVLVESRNPPSQLHAAIISRIKIMSNISIAQKRIPQDGRMQVLIDGRCVDLRVSTLPTSHGESAVMRVLDRNRMQTGLGDLGLQPDDRTTVEQLTTRPDGIVLVTGPTGSGKTSTLYGCLQQLNQSNRKIITVEDPVEFELKGINQVPVRSSIGMTFAAALRAMLRQAPNIVMVGEIRDRETAEIAINASLTGHMVFSTLHTNDAPSAITRLMDMGIKPFLLAASVRGIIAQRLVRRVCAECGRPYQPTASELRALGLDARGRVRHSFMQGQGCATCRGSGFNGRLGIFEICVINEPLQQMIHERSGLARLRQKAWESGMRTLREDGARKVSAGLTTAAEVVCITVGGPANPTT